MRRRSLLTGIGVLSAGCIGPSPPRVSTATQTPENDETPNPTDAPTCPGESETTETTDGPATGGEYRLTDLTESTSVDRPSVRYVLEPSAFYSSDAVEREEERTGKEQTVKEVSEINDEAVRTAIESAIQSGGWRSNTLPDGLAETVERVDFFTGVAAGETHTHVGLTLYEFQPDSPPALEFSASIVDHSVSKESPGVVEFELANASQTTQRVFSGTVPPFGMVFAERVESDDRFLLWRNYEDEGCVRFSEDGLLQCDIGKVTELRPCESVTRRYEVLPSGTSHHPEYTEPPGPATYRITDSLDYYEEQGAPESELSFEVEFTLESR